MIKTKIMIEVLYFALKALIVLLFFASLIILIALVAAKAGHKGELEVEPLHKKYTDWGFFLKSFVATKEELKLDKKNEKEKLKREKKANAQSIKSSSKTKNADEKPEQKKKVFVLNFVGDIKAHHVDNLREEITAILNVATTNDEVVAKIESPGGVVHGYGLGASQLKRIKDKGISLTVCVDKVAASGGYLMSCVANKILAAPFAIIGSVGVVAQVPNVHRVLKKWDIDYKEYTAGEFKRTVSMLGEITPKGEAKFQEQLESTHVLFKDFVSQNRPQLDVAKIATGEYWFGEQALKLGLVDKIQTSDDYLLEFHQDSVPLFEIKFQAKQSFAQKISEILGQAAEISVNRILTQLEKQRLQ